MQQTRRNHYVPVWHQRGFMADDKDQLWLLKTIPEIVTNSQGKEIQIPQKARPKYPKQCFFEMDLYTTFFGDYINDDIETQLFKKLDDKGAEAIRAFSERDPNEWVPHFEALFEYLDSQKIRTPKGLEWIKTYYPELGQIDLMMEMQQTRIKNCVFWAEGVREIVSAVKSEVKFIVSDHPLTVYNHALAPNEHKFSSSPNEPPVVMKGSQTVFPFSKDYCLILTNVEYADDPDCNPLEKRTNPTTNRYSMARTDNFICSRDLNSEEVTKINLILKSNSHRYVAASNPEFLFPERQVDCL